MEDTVKNLSDKSREALSKFKENLKDVLTPAYTDTTLLKWLRARNFDVKSAERIFRQNYNNRVLFGVNTITDTYKKPEVTQKYEATGIIGFAKDGTLIRYIASGRIDFYGIIMSMSCLELCLYFSYIMECDIEALKEESLKTGRSVDEMTYIFDLEGFHIQQILHKNVIEMGLDYLRLLQDCYPEIWRRILIINVPFFYSKIVNLFKPVMRTHALEKMRIANKDSSRELLLQYIDEDVLPMFLGGKRVDSNGDAMCREFLTFGGVIPEEMYYRKRSTLLSEEDPGVKRAVIGPGTVYNYAVSVQEGGTNICLQIRSDGSLSTAVFYRAFREQEDRNNPELPSANEFLDENDDNCPYEAISVCLRPQLHCVQENMDICLGRPGIYAVRFSNAGSWFTSKKILLRHTLYPPSTSRQEQILSNI